MDESGPKVATHQEMFGAILTVTGWRVPAVSAGRVGKLAKDLLASGVFPHDVLLRFGTTDPGEGWWWYSSDWRGKLGQRPDEKALRECAGKWEQAVAVQLPAAPNKWAGVMAWQESAGDE